MDQPQTPVYRSKISSDSDGSLNNTPGTPKPPFDPPRRRSSLAFSRVVISPNADESSTQDHNGPRSNIGRKRATISSPQRSTANPNHIADTQSLFRTANASLHLDMHYATLPSGSIDSRFPSDSSSPIGQNLHDDHRLQIVQKLGRNWRYSTLPDLLMKTSMDVREPLPVTSPTLPDVSFRHSETSPLPCEPVSDGFASPTAGGRNDDDDGDEKEYLGHLPALPMSSPTNSDKDCHLATALDGPMSGLKVEYDEDLFDRNNEDSPSAEHCRKRATGISDIPIFLSYSARAAAESARAKRGLKKIFDANPANEIDQSKALAYSEPESHQSPQFCPDPAVHRSTGLSPCPEPGLHQVSSSPGSVMAHQMGSRLMHDSYLRTGEEPMSPYRMIIPGSRANAAGSPMPFLRSKAPLFTAHLERRTPQSPHMTPNSADRRIERPCRKIPGSSITTTRPHFETGWYHAQKPSTPRNRTENGTYSFSTAAAKVTGESAAPDSRIRDSYRTDTLTPIVKPLHRFRRNGIGANINSRGSGRFYGSPVPTRSSRYEKQYPGRDQHSLADNVRFRSSPPRPSSSYSPAIEVRKRRRDLQAQTPDYESMEGSLLHPESERDDNLMIIDDDTRAALRMSLYGTNTPQALHGPCEGIRDLSPNVDTWRKGLEGNPLSRKKRRPSYWDGDLEEVRMSPAGRGGIASSPTVSKRSMVARMENIENESDARSHSHDHYIVDNHTEVLIKDQQSDHGLQQTPSRPGGAISDQMEIEIEPTKSIQA